MGKETKIVWILTELFYPEQTSTSFILTKIANRFAEGYEVRVISGPAVYDQARAGFTEDSSFTCDERVVIERVSCPDLDKRRLSSRFLRQVIISLKMAGEIIRKIKKGDIVFIVTNPAPLLLLVALLRRWKKYKFILYVNDVFPENTIPAGIMRSKKSISYRFMSSVFNWAYRKADLLITIGRDMDEVVRIKLGKKGTEGKTLIIENWADLDIISPNKTSNIDSDKVRIQFAGNVGRVQGLPDFLSLYHKADNPSLCLDVWGDGAMRKTLEAYVQDNHLIGVSFHGAYKRSSQNEVLNSCDIALVSLSRGMYGLGVPSKSYNIMAAGKPILFLGDLNSEIALEIKEHDMGYAFKIEDEDKIVEWLKGLTSENLLEFKKKGSNARETVVSLYSEKAILDKFYKVLG